ncbi:MAG: 16S rRNA (adenine(1518)-N(6)/adenine(1519)-N(6))-dimethyltransferase RsmA [Candidatus Zixiibacteriota bacterium]
MTVYKKSLGQHILQNIGAARRIVESLGIERGDSVLEIGPGRGVLTGIMAELPIQLIAVEVDRRFVVELRERFKSADNMTIINESILDVNIRSIVGDNRCKLVGNLPYNLSSQILKKAFENHDLFPLAVFTVQKEVADRMTAHLGSRDYSSLTVFTETYSRSEKLFTLKPGSFYPPPKVSSAVVRLTFRDSIPIAGERREAFSRFVQSIFAHRRKTILNSLTFATSLSRDRLESVLENSEIDDSVRPQNVSLDRFVSLFNALDEVKDA